MLIAPNVFLDEYKNATYSELLDLKNELVERISKFENDFDMKDHDWSISALPDVHYQWNLKVLSGVATLLMNAFNREYEIGEKDISDFYRDIKSKKH